MSALRAAAAVVLTAIAVVAVILARDVHAWHDAIAQGDSVYAVTPGRATWSPSQLAGGTAEALLGVGDDVEMRRALQLYLRAASTPDRLDTATERQSLRAQAARALAKAARGGHASRANTLLGVLAYDGTTGADAAIADFSNAVRADTSNTAAKFDLELMLRLTEARGARSGSGPGGAFGRGGRRGAGGGAPGSGY